MILKRYFLSYSIYLTLITLATIVIQTVLSAMGQEIPNFIGQMLGFAPAWITAYTFVNDHNRIPSPSEKQTLVWDSFCTSYHVPFRCAGSLLYIWFFLKEIPCHD